MIELIQGNANLLVYLMKLTINTLFFQTATAINVCIAYLIYFEKYFLIKTIALWQHQWVPPGR
jgi:hypothetical protein